MQALKGLVGGLGVLIVVAMSMIGYGLYRKSIDPGFKFFSSEETPAAPARTATATTAARVTPPATFGEVTVDLPKGCAIAGVGGDGNRIYLRIGPDTPECSRVVVLDAATGARVGVIRIAR